MAVAPGPVFEYQTHVQPEGTTWREVRLGGASVMFQVINPRAQWRRAMEHQCRQILLAGEASDDR